MATARFEEGKTYILTVPAVYPIKNDRTYSFKVIRRTAKIIWLDDGEKLRIRGKDDEYVVIPYRTICKGRGLEAKNVVA